MKWERMHRLYPDAVSSIVSFISDKYDVVRTSVLMMTDGLSILDKGGLYQKVGTEDLLDWMVSKGFYLNVFSEVVGSKVLLYYRFLFELNGEMCDTDYSKGFETYGEVFETALKQVLGVIQKREQKLPR